MKNFSHFVLILITFIFSQGFANTTDDTAIRTLIQSFKQDDRGPYQAIRWFCPDGTVIPANQRCSQPGGIQHALHKDVVQKIASEKGIFLGQILAGTPYNDFLDSSNDHSRLKQYQLEKFLQNADDGWIFRKARFYRGAIQAEDEERWGLEFLKWLLAKDEFVRSQFFLTRQAGKEIPHLSEDKGLTLIRALSKTIADSIPSFMNIRIKIHGQPDASDLQRIRDFRRHNGNRISPDIAVMLDDLERELEIAYRPTDFQSLLRYVEAIPAVSPIAIELRKIVKRYSGPAVNPPGNTSVVRNQCDDISNLLWLVRRNLLSLPSPAQRLNMIDLSNELENVLFRLVAGWHPRTVGELLDKNYILAKAAAGCGFLEIWEWQMIEGYLQPGNREAELSFAKFNESTIFARRVVEWSTGMIHAVYGSTINLFSGFEPLSNGFIDELVRSSVLLRLGQTAGHLREMVSTMAGVSNQVMGIRNPNEMHGLNPGFAFGELVVLREEVEKIEFSASKIYMLPYAPTDLKPVAGIATVSEGNLVSHVQLLARNLGIPNAVLSEQNLRDLQRFTGQSVFYAVSPRGAVLMKPASQMNAQERGLVEDRKRPEAKIQVPTNRIDLNQTGLVNLREIQARDSGRLCGPKAANLGQLKNLFPTMVVEGIVIPFGVFKHHLDHPMPKTTGTYWQFLQDTFIQRQNRSKSEAEIEEHILARLAVLRKAIQSIPLLPDFEQELREKFLVSFGAGMGKVPVFIRSDTNMEDLKDFTGAGLNLTVFNVAEEVKIFQAIRDVWASPYTERSYRWRQKYLLNPENVFPSILILPTVNVDKSGVLITSGFSSTNSKAIMVAFNRGAGGAVEGQKAESYLLTDGGVSLISPSREQKHTVLPKSGGVEKKTSYFAHPILTREELEKLRDVGEEIKRKLPSSPGMETKGPFDVELGFLNDKILLFQVRPFVENKRAQASVYLRSLDPAEPRRSTISLSERIKVEY